MNIQGLIAAVGKVAQVVYPPAVPFLSFLEKAEPYAEETMPLVKAALQEGPAAFTAVKTAAPEFFHQLGELTAAIKSQIGVKNSIVTEGDLAVVASHIVGIDPPGWTREETEIWWDHDKASFT